MSVGLVSCERIERQVDCPSKVRMRVDFGEERCIVGLGFYWNPIPSWRTNSALDSVQTTLILNMIYLYCSHQHALLRCGDY